METVKGEEVGDEYQLPLHHPSSELPLLHQAHHLTEGNCQGWRGGWWVPAPSEAPCQWTWHLFTHERWCIWTRLIVGNPFLNLSSTNIPGLVKSHYEENFLAEGIFSSRKSPGIWALLYNPMSDKASFVKDQIPNFWRIETTSFFWMRPPHLLAPVGEAVSYEAAVGWHHHPLHPCRVELVLHQLVVRAVVLNTRLSSFLYISKVQATPSAHASLCGELLTFTFLPHFLFLQIFL